MKYNQIDILRAALPATLLLTLGISAAPEVTAQDAEEETVLEEVVITGSRIRQDPLEQRLPVLTLGEEDYRATGAASLAEFVQKLPISGSAINQTNNSSGNLGFPPDGGGIGAGAAEIDLRYLTSKRVLVLVDGQGIAHPRRFGVASHIGVLLDLPTIGCAKTKLVGRYEEPRSEKGSYSYLKYGEETIGAVVRTRSKVKPLFVSIGHRINLQDSINMVLRCCSKYRLPETTRRADRLARGGMIS